MIDREQLYSVIEHTKIAFSEEEIREIEVELQSALTLFSDLKKVDINNVEPLFYPNMQQYNFRPEDLLLKTEREALLENTEDAENGYFKFDAILQGGDQ